MIGRDEASLGRALDKISVSLADFARHGLIEQAAIPGILARIVPSVRLEDAAEAQLVIEAVTEDLALKREPVRAAGQDLRAAGGAGLVERPAGERADRRGRASASA